MSRNLLERARIRCEIIIEHIVDSIGSNGDRMRKPIVCLVAVALFMTLRAGKRGTRGANGAFLAAYSPYGTGRTSQSAAQVYPGGSSYGGAQPFRPASSIYGQQNRQLPATGGIYPQQQAAGGYPQQQLSYSTTPMAAGGLSAVSGLVDMHGASLNILQPGMLRDFGGVTDFQGQVETLQGIDSAGVVEQVLSQPGQNKVLVVDAGGDLRSAIFDANMAQTAHRNGWSGVVVNGAIRNASQIASIPIGVKAVGTNPVRGQASSGQQGAALTIGGLQIHPGFWIYADKDGVVVSQQLIAGASLSGGSVGGLRGGTPVGGPKSNYYGGAASAVPMGASAIGNQYATGQQTAYGGYGGTVANPAAARPYSSTGHTGIGGAGGAQGTRFGSPNMNYGSSSYRRAPPKKFKSKFIGMCFLFVAMILLAKSFQDE